MKSIKETRSIKMLLTRLSNFFSDAHKMPDVGHLSYQLPFLRCESSYFFLFLGNIILKAKKQETIPAFTDMVRKTKKVKRPLLSPSSSNKGEFPPLVLIGHQRKKALEGRSYSRRALWHFAETLGDVWFQMRKWEERQSERRGKKSQT